MVAGRYRLRSLLGAGAMGVVWRADDLRLDREVALKQLRVPPGLAPEETARARQRVFREGRVAARLQHPHAVAVYDVAADDSGQPMLVLEFLPSRSLATALTEHGALSPARVARIGAPVASALAAAHAAGVVHRDVKPGNVLLDGDGGAKITDFGLSHIAGDVGDGLVAGTPVFLSPEAAIGERPSPASDVFSLGATLYMAVEGRPPFGKADNPMAQLERVAAGQAPPPRRAGPLTALLTSMLHDDPGSRPTMARVADSLAEIAATLPADEPALAEPPAAPVVLDGSAADELTVDGLAANESATAENEAAADDITLDRIDTRGAAVDEPVFDETAFDRTAVHGVVTDRPAAEESAFDETAVHGVVGDGTAYGETAVHRVVDDETAFDETAVHGVVGDGTAFDETTVHGVVTDQTAVDDVTLDGIAAASATRPGAAVDDDVVATRMDLDPVTDEPRTPRRRRRAIVLGVLALLVVALLVLLATGALTGRDDNAGAPATRPAPPPGTASSALVQPTGAPPSTVLSAAPRPVDATALQRVVADYYALLPDRPAQAWTLLGPAMRAQDRAGYDKFWSTVKDLRLRTAPAVTGNAVVVELEYTQEGRGRVRATHQHDMLADGGPPLINSDRVLSTEANGNQESRKNEPPPPGGPAERPR